MSNTAHPADRWLREQQIALEAELTEALDLEAGLQEILAAAHHAELVEDLEQTLDLDAGLFEIVPEAHPAASARVPEPGSAADRTHDAEALALRRLPLPYRWELRNRMLQGGLEQACMYASHVLRTQPHNRFDHSAWFEWIELTRDASTSASDAATRGFEVGLGYLTTLNGPGGLRAQVPLKIIGVLEKCWAEQLSRINLFIAHTTAWRNTVAHGKKITPAVKETTTKNLRQVTDDLYGTLHALNDFVAADLRQPGLEKQHLDGLRWSAKTEFPESWKDEIDRDSVPIGDGVFEVRPGNTRNTQFA